MKQSIFHRFIPITSCTLGSIFLLYYIAISLSYGLGQINFSWTFLALGVLATCYGILELKLKKHLFHYLPQLLRRICFVFFIIALTIFIGVEAMILYHGSTISSTQGNYAIVLGTQLKGRSISRLLRYRLDAAVEFHKQYPDATIIVSGGQGPGEDISEAQAMHDYLIAKGVPESLILMEDQSKNTEENFRYSKELLKNDTNQNISIITNSFHMYRASFLCSELGMTCSLYLAKTDIDLAPTFYFREFFGVIKDKVL